MRKSDKKIENALRVVLTEACDMALESHPGFMWLTHFVNYKNIPDSLSIVCVFDTNEKLSKADTEGVCETIKDRLSSIDINIKNIRQHVSFDTQENCEIQNNGKWQERFK